MAKTLQQNILYGPYFSRRLGRSFGVNLFHAPDKVCSFDCVYCEIGKTQNLTINPSLDSFFEIDEVLDVLKAALKKPRAIQMLTLSGNGEPTLHPLFYEIVAGIKKTITDLQPQAKIALLTNGSTSNRVSIQAAFRLIDQVMIKLDAGDPETFEKVNQPVHGFGYFDLIEGLRQTPGLTLQCCLIEGDITNAHGKPYDYWMDMVRCIHPAAVHIYSVERPTRDKDVQKVSQDRLLDIEKELQEFGINAKAFWR